HEGHAGAERPFLTAWAQRLPTHRFGRVESQVPAVEGGDWQEVNECQVNRDQRCEMDEIDPPQTQLLAGKLGDLDRPAEFLNRPSAGHDLSDSGHHHIDGLDGLLARQHHRFTDTDLNQLSSVGPDSELPDPEFVAEPVTLKDRAQLDRQDQSLAVTLEFEHDALTRMRGDLLHHIREALDRVAVDGHEPITCFDASSGCGTVLIEHVHHRRYDQFAEGEVDRGEDHDGDKQVG